MKLVHPQVYLIGETCIVPERMQAFLEAIGVPEWHTDGDSDAEVIVEAEGKLCYLSFDASLNKNLTRTGTRSNFDYIQQGLIATGHGCYDSDTEVLTSEGWKVWPDVTYEDFLATRTSDGVLEYHRPLHLIAAPYKGRMYRVEARGVDLLVTGNHNMLVCKTTTKEGRKKEDFNLLRADELGHVSHAYVKTAKWDKAEESNATMWSMLGFAIGDAYYQGGVLRFSLHRGRKIAFLQTLCSQLKWELRSNPDEGKYRVIVPAKLHSLFEGIYTEDRAKQIPQGLLLSLGRGSLMALFYGLMESDGHHGATGDSFDTTSRVLAGQMQQLCLHIGLAANVCYTYSKEDGKRESSFGDKPLTRLSIIHRELKPEVNKFAGGVGRSYWVDDWEGEVFCAEVPNNTLYVRRNGIPVWCGNSVLEHCAVNLMFVNVSRVLCNELVRHRAGAAYSQQSGRYVRLDELSFWVPSVIRENIELAELFDEAITHQESILRKMVKVSRIDSMTGRGDFEKKKELTSAFRRIIGNGQATSIGATYNHRALRHIIEARTSRHAEEEIRIVFNEVFLQVSDRYPAFYADVHKEMVNGHFELVFSTHKV